MFNSQPGESDHKYEFEGGDESFEYNFLSSSPGTGSGMGAFGNFRNTLYEMESLFHQNADNSNDNNSSQKGSNSKGSFALSSLSNIAAMLITLTFVLVVPYITIHSMLNDDTRADYAAFYSAGAFVLITLLISTRLIYYQLTHWYMPDVQKYVVRILWMVPLYAIQSWLSLRFHKARIYIDTLRDLYEAFVIQSFLYYLIELLGGESTLVLLLRSKADHHGHHQSVFRYFFSTWEMGLEFMLQCKHGVLQYVVVKTVATLLTACLEPIGLYGEGTFQANLGYPYISFFINTSQMWALYCLIKFYHATADDLRCPTNWKPMGKFLCVKGVVFFTWWQGVGIAMLKSHGFIDDVGSWSGDDVANGLQDYLVCVEMFFFAIAHGYTFTHEEYLPKYGGGGDGSGPDMGIPSLSSSIPGGEIGSSGSWQPINRTLGTKRGKNGIQPEEDENDIDYTPPTIRTLHKPMGFRDAFWSSTVPNETLSDIKRFRNGVSDQVMNQSSDVGMISMACIQHAESI